MNTDRDIRLKENSLWRRRNCPDHLLLFAGFVVIGGQFRGWLVLGCWPTIALHDVLDWWMGRPISIDRLETDCSSYWDGQIRRIAEWEEVWRRSMKVFRWILDSVPLALWLIALLPPIWFLIWICIFKLFGASRRTPQSTN